MTKSTSATLDYLLAPKHGGEFFAQYAEQKPFIIRRNDPDYYRSLLQYQDLIRFFERQDLTYPGIRIVSQGKEIPAQHFSTNVDYKQGQLQFRDQVKTKYLASHFLDQGHSIIIYQAQQSIPQVGAFCEQLQQVFRHHVQANIYLTPANSKGFDVHFDNHDLFVLQLSGSKHWKVFNQPYHLPYEEEKDNHILRQAVRSGCMIDEELYEGDLIYIPRGYVHEVESRANSSIHMTVGLKALRWRKLLERISQYAERDTFLRGTLPTNIYEIQNLAAHKQAFKDYLADLVDREFEKKFEVLVEEYAQTADKSRLKEMEALFASVGKKLRQTVLEPTT